MRYLGRLADVTSGTLASPSPIPVENGQSPGLLALEAVVFLIGVAILGSLLVWWGRRIFNEN